MDLAHFIDHTILSADATRKEVLRYCNEARKFGFASVCVNSMHVKLVADALRDSGVACCSVVGFPLGAMSTQAKAFEAATAVVDGAKEIDMVMAIGAAKEGDFDYVEKDIREVVNAVKAESSSSVVKVILETCLLTDSEIVSACRAAMRAGADFVKTSTGFSRGGATVEAVELMRQTVGDKLGVKASGGIHTIAQAETLIAAGANRLGASHGMDLLPNS